ncbi:M14 family metallocarboxypeptidase [Alteromonadaceae bacterium BrNp21-10]|nr:M14 family metallocarboxypeptidase [Alteromonadaceae bacterium BrNp21-10]
MNSEYPIGIIGQPWNAQHKAQWFEQQKVRRSYQQNVVAKLSSLGQHFDIIQYGSLPIDPVRYPLYMLKSRLWNNNKPTVLVTGGVHGYETSGVHGALAFAVGKTADYVECFNLMVAPCISPWGYETINRWNPAAIDPNRAFYSNSPSEEAAQLIQALAPFNQGIVAHIDLHETTDSDNSEFRPALAARDGIVQHSWNIPDGFYVVDDSQKPQAAFQQAIIAEVEKVTHIAPADEHGEIIGSPIQQRGVIHYDVKQLALCAGITDAKYVSTTEVYPDSPNATDEICIQAQVAAIVGGLNYLQKKN